MKQKDTSTKRAILHRSILEKFNGKLIAIILIVLQIGILFGAFIWLCTLYYWIFYIFEALAFVAALFCANSKMDANYRIVWILVITLLPVIGLLLYLYFADKKFTKKELRKLAPIVKSLEQSLNSKANNGFAGKTDDDSLNNLSHYIKYASDTDLYKNTKTTYFAWGDDAFPVMLQKLREAKHYIFMEYFIIDEGLMWNSILSILKDKAAEGVDVRVMYDGLGCIATLPPKYEKFLRSLGIKCIIYERVRPVVDVRLNNRDHRKILVIDGHTGFTGGINLADEYINKKVRFGKWKDNAIMLEGEGVYGLTTLFLGTWIAKSDKYEMIDFEKFGPHVYASERKTKFEDDGYVQAYGSLPYTYETTGANVYEALALRARKYLWITTPYLILNDTMRKCLCAAAKLGVDVRIVTPFIPDKKMVFIATRANYKALLQAGVKIFEFTPGFIHQKVTLTDDIYATVGTINFDYRSLFLHMENGLLMYKTSSIKDIKTDFENIFRISYEYTLEQYALSPWYMRVVRFILKLFAPLM